MVRQLSTVVCHCARHLASNVLSFFTFPADEEIRRKWIVAIRRDKFMITAHTRVCSRHFKPEDIPEPASETARRLLKRGSVPELFKWNKTKYTDTDDKTRNR
uniref:THAP domain-containing protein 1 n=1 Tax=Sparus aurata TaxID=8175 RepID=A0A671WIH7_SPAAU